MIKITLDMNSKNVDCHKQYHAIKEVEKNNYVVVASSCSKYYLAKKHKLIYDCLNNEILEATKCKNQ